MQIRFHVVLCTNQYTENAPGDNTQKFDPMLVSCHRYIYVMLRGFLNVGEFIVLVFFCTVFNSVVQHSSGDRGSFFLLKFNGTRTNPRLKSTIQLPRNWKCHCQSYTSPLLVTQ
ncbi:uncharacterized protein LOC143150436 isoform X1 [Ptiloglossa arizonensis]|uniref:uncharacterized protein LOC143150436 isoform X1 n=1 Tax=Ptiloglossa arizonensis TaxID=3350558 RepID=UPI003F9EC83F